AAEPDAEDRELAGRALAAMQAAGCPACHTTGGPAAGTRLQVPAGPASSEQLRLFEEGARRLVDRAEPARSLLRAKPTFRVTHTGGRLIEPESEQDLLLQQWAERLARLAPPGDTAEPAPYVSSASRMLR